MFWYLCSITYISFANKNYKNLDVKHIKNFLLENCQIGKKFIIQKSHLDEVFIIGYLSGAS